MAAEPERRHVADRRGEPVGEFDLPLGFAEPTDGKLSPQHVTLMVVVRERTAIDVKGTGWALAGRVPGTVAGALILTAIPQQALAMLIAGVVLGGVALTSLGWIPAPRRRNLVLAGATGAGVHVLTG